MIRSSRRLLRRLDHNFGVRGTTHKWINSYLDGRNQFVRVGDRTSEPAPCEFGVPQGSVLGPLLFTIYTSPITNVIAQFKHVNHAQYADDTQLYVALNTDDAIRVINDCFKSVHCWLDANGLCLNPDKTEAIVIGMGAKLRSEETRIWHVTAKHANRMDARAHTSTLAECAPRFMTPRSQGFVGQSSPNLAHV